MVLLAVGLWTAFHWMLIAPDGVLAQAASTILKLPAVAVLTVQPLAQPKPLGWLAKGGDALVNPLGVVQVPVAAVQADTSTDLTAVPVVGKASELKV